MSIQEKLQDITKVLTSLKKNTVDELITDSRTPLSGFNIAQGKEDLAIKVMTQCIFYGPVGIKKIVRKIGTVQLAADNAETSIWKELTNSDNGSGGSGWRDLCTTLARTLSDQVDQYNEAHQDDPFIPNTYIMFGGLWPLCDQRLKDVSWDMAPSFYNQPFLRKIALQAVVKRGLSGTTAAEQLLLERGEEIPIPGSEELLEEAAGAGTAKQQQQAVAEARRKLDQMQAKKKADLLAKRTSTK